MRPTGKVWHAEVLSTAAAETIKRFGALESIRSFYLLSTT